MRSVMLITMAIMSSTVLGHYKWTDPLHNAGHIVSPIASKAISVGEDVISVGEDVVSVREDVVSVGEDVVSEAADDDLLDNGGVLSGINGDMSAVGNLFDRIGRWIASIEEVDCPDSEEGSNDCYHADDYTYILVQHAHHLGSRGCCFSDCDVS